MGIDFINEEQMLYIEGIVSKPLILNAWVTGGSLLRADSPDVDIAVYTKHPFTVEDAEYFLTPGYYIEKACEQYIQNDNDGGSGKDLIIKLKPMDSLSGLRPIDLLVSHVELRDRGIVGWMNTYYPFSVQCCAYSVLDEDMVAEPNEIPEVIICNSFVQDDSPYLKKYKRYYPNAQFMRGM